MVRTKLNPLVIDFSQFGKAEDLITATIRKNRLFPAREVMQTARITYHV